MTTTRRARLKCWVHLGIAAAMLLAAGGARAQRVDLQAEDAVVWAQEQVVDGAVTGSAAGSGVLYVGAEATPFTVEDGAFAVGVRLGSGTTALVACVEEGAVCSDTLRWTLGFTPRPEAELTASVEGRAVTLRGQVLANPDGTALTFAWAADPENPAPVALAVASDSVAAFTLPEDAPAGEYYVDWTLADADGDAFRARTFVTATEDGVVPFDLATDHAAWIDRAVLYEITPRFFADYQRGRFEHITRRIPELVALGIDTIWLQPVFGTAAGDQAYDVTDYFGLWDVLGTEADLRTLIETAHAAGLRVLFDFVANHSSIEHPYAQDAVAYGPRSHYYDFYLRESDGAPYSFYYNTLQQGAMTFVYYFWQDLMTWDFANPEVERFIIEASRYWIEAFDIDGYRFDAVWGPHARDPAFTQAWRRALKRVKPEILMLAEAKAPYSEAYEGTGHPSTFASFDVAYDWTDDRWCISQWVWARDCGYSAYEEGTMRTIFNSGVEGLRARDLRNALTNYGQGFPDDAVILRFLENNDVPRMRAHHTAAQAKMAAALLFALDGVPMLYYGQELGTPYQYPSYPPGDPLRQYDRDGMWAYYQHLIRLRKTFGAFTSAHRAEVPVGPSVVSGHTYAFWRDGAAEDVVAAINLADDAVAAVLALPVSAMGLEDGATYYLTDLTTGDARALTTAELASVEVMLPAYTTRLWALADAPVVVPTAADPAPEQPADAPAIEVVYPHPVRTTATLAVTLPAPGPVRLTVHDVLGRRVATLLDAARPAGRHEVAFDARDLASGLYVARLEHGGRVETATIVRIR